MIMPGMDEMEEVKQKINKAEADLLEAQTQWRRAEEKLKIAEDTKPEDVGKWEKEVSFWKEQYASCRTTLNAFLARQHRLQTEQAAGQLTASAGGEPEPAESRKRRWTKLNNVLDINKKAKTTIRADALPSVGYSYVVWEQVKDIFPVVPGIVGSDSYTSLPEPQLNALADYLSCASICMGSISEGHEAKRVHFIAPIIIIVCAFFNGDIQILAEEDIEGNRVHAHGHFEFVLKRGGKRMCIVEAKKDDILQGKTQSLVGCESLSDVDNVDVVYGVATNFLEWCFLRNAADGITEEMLTIQFADNKPTKDSLLIVANKIISILS